MAYWRISDSVAAFGSPYGPKSGPGLTACFDTLNSRQPPVACLRRMATASCATAWCAKKLSSKLLRRISSDTSPILPCHAAPAFDTTMSTPPKRRAIAAKASR